MGSEAFGTATIAALATPPAAGGIGILRVSGPDAKAVCLPLVPSLGQALPLPEPRRAYTAALCARDGTRLDTGLWLSFDAPASYTGEDVVELHAHGSPVLLRLLLRELLVDPRVRLAEPGEFTRRAFLNGKLDLAQADAVAELIAADSEAAVRAAASQLSGALSVRLRALLAPLRELHADLEALLDFPEESEGAEAGLAERLEALRDQAGALLAGAERGRLVRSGARLALFGPPNAGKSTLFNALLGEERALVDEEPGTTRDVLEARWLENGLSLTLLDTAGLREATERVERRGVAAARAALQGIDAALLVLPLGAQHDGEEARWRREVPPGVPTLVVRSKADLAGGAEGRSPDAAGAEVTRVLCGESRPGVPASEAGASGTSLREARAAADPLGGPRQSPSEGRDPLEVQALAGGVPGPVRVSAKTGEGLEAVRAWVSGLLGPASVGGAVALVGERNAQALREIDACLRTAADALAHGTLELVAGEVMLAHETLSGLLGERADRELLDALFARFCIGK